MVRRVFSKTQRAPLSPSIPSARPSNNPDAEKESAPSGQHSQQAASSTRIRTRTRSVPLWAIICGAAVGRGGAPELGRSVGRSVGRCVAASLRSAEGLCCVQAEESRCFSSRCGFAPPPAAASVSASHFSTCVTRSRGASKHVSGLGSFQCA